MTWSASGLVVCFGPTRALDGVDLALEPGRVHAVIGGDGSGKSTLLRVLAGVQRVDEGEVQRPPSGVVGFVSAGGRVVAAGTVPDIIGGRSVVEVAAPDWPAALAALEHGGRVVLLDGQLIRVLGEDADAVGRDLERASIAARVRLVAASLNETLVELSRAPA